jgi:hypothetical protein
MSELEELLERFRRGPELLASAATGAAGAELDYIPGPDNWSVRQILCHVADSEIVAAGRFRRIIAEDHPPLMAFDQDAWARNLDYQRRRTAQALETFRHIRAENYELLKSLPEAAFERTGVHPERGEVTLLQQLRVFAQHPEKHAGQIRRVRAAYKQAGSGT